MRLKLFILLFICAVASQAQYAPAPGDNGSIAIHRDSSAISGWADSCIVSRGYIDISDTNAVYEGSNRASYGADDHATGYADNYAVSLGDGGIASLYFSTPIHNGPSFDFAIFENSFSDNFLELAFVEVSSDGVNYFRFPSASLSDTNTQVESFGFLNPEEIHNLAGKYRMFYGTPFDLEELKGITGLNIDSITHIKIIDVVGSIQTEYGSRDSQGRMINDPFPTPFNSGGFDLDAVAILNTETAGIASINIANMGIYPNPVKKGNPLYIKNISKNANVEIYNMNGIKQFVSYSENTVNTESLRPGFYTVKITDHKYLQTIKLIVY